MPEVVKMTDVAQRAWACPKDGTEMAPMGRRSNAWRCPACKAVFLDVEAMGRGRTGKPPLWVPVISSVAMAAIATVIARRLFRHSKP